MRKTIIIFLLTSIIGLGGIGSSAYAFYHLGTKKAKKIEPDIVPSDDFVGKTNFLEEKSSYPKDILINKLQSINEKYLISKYNIILGARIFDAQYDTRGKNFVNIMKNFLFDALITNNIDISFDELNLIENINNLEWKTKSTGAKMEEVLLKIYSKNDDELFANSSFTSSRDLHFGYEIQALKIKVKIKNSSDIVKEIVLNILRLNDLPLSTAAFYSEIATVHSIFDYLAVKIDKKDENGKELDEEDWVYNIEIPKKHYIDSYYQTLTTSIFSYFRSKVRNIFSFPTYFTSNLYGFFDENGAKISYVNFGKNLEKTKTFNANFSFWLPGPNGVQHKKAYVSHKNKIWKVSLKFV